MSKDDPKRWQNGCTHSTLQNIIPTERTGNIIEEEKHFTLYFWVNGFPAHRSVVFEGKGNCASEWKGIVACLPLEHVCKLAAGLRCHLRAQNGLQLPPFTRRWQEGLKATANWLCELLGNCRGVTAISQDPTKFKVHWRIFESVVDAAFNPKLKPSWGES